jgi:ATP-dependent DNA helicase RecG
MKLDDSIQYIKGVGPKRAKLFARLKVHTIEDACLFLPRRYEDRSHIKPISQLQIGATETIIGEIKQAGVVTTRRRGRRIFEVTVGDGNGIITAKWFHFNTRYMTSLFKVGERIILNGLVEEDRYGFFGGKQILHPNYEILARDDEEDPVHTGRIVPIYPTTEGFHQKSLRSIMKRIIDEYAPQLPDILPPQTLERQQLIPISQAVQQAHFPENSTDLELLNNGLSPAHRRLVFEEFFLLELGLASRRQHLTHDKLGIAFQPAGDLSRKLRKLLPFSLTAAQERVLNEIKQDMAKPQAMNRLLQGDVGSGKTVVALFTLLEAVESGYQAAIMAPTEILAEQHYLNLHPLLDELGINTLLLKGDIKAKQKQEAYHQIATGEVQVVIGTHAIIQQKVRFARLGLAIIDEQHRFGVMQRANLMRKGYHPDVLVMTATPIPRTLALTVYGDLALSVIDEMPPGRLPVETRRCYDRDRAKVYSFINKQIQAGGQAYIVYPLVEESDKLELKAAADMADHLQQHVFPHLKVGLIHGRLSSQEKEDIMRDFKQHKLHILVATTVIEVGIDIPNASVMVIEHAERFGLAQLHQLRGRVGRGQDKSYCILLVHYPVSDEAKLRLNAMLNTQDGFIIAEEDLKIRGPGEFLGTRQSGLPDLKVANIIRDARLLEAAREEAFALIQHDPQLSLPQHKPLKEALLRKWKHKLELVRVG